MTTIVRRHGSQSRKLRDHIPTTHQQQRELERGGGYRLPLVIQFPSKASCPKSSISSPDSTTDWGPSAQYLSLCIIFHSIYNILPIMAIGS